MNQEYGSQEPFQKSYVRKDVKGNVMGPDLLDVGCWKDPIARPRSSDQEFF